MVYAQLRYDPIIIWHDRDRGVITRFVLLADNLFVNYVPGFSDTDAILG